MNFQPTATERPGAQKLAQDEMMHLVAAAEARKSKMIAFITALVAHVLLLGAFVFVVWGKGLSKKPDLIVSAPYAPVEQLRLEKPSPVHFKADRPAEPSSSMAKVVVADAPSNIQLPKIEVMVDDPTLDFGTAFGDGLGDGLGGMGGSGLGGTFFGTPIAGKSVILVIDVSNSMPKNCGGRGIKAIRAEIKRTITGLRPGSKFNVICYGGMADGFRPRLVTASSSNKKQAIEFTKAYFTRAFNRTRTADGINRKHPIPYVPIRPRDFNDTEDTAGGSRYDLALVAAFQQRPEVIFLLTDGEPRTTRRGKRLSKEEILSLVLRAGKSKSGRQPVVNGISVNGIGKSYLKEIARAFRGTVKVIEPRKL